jgi:hypothetical protein
MSQHVFEELPRPVVAFLLGGCRLRPDDALAGCLRELADEGLVRYQTDASGMPVFSLGADSPRTGRPLLAFEQAALARVRGRAGRLGHVPFSALVSDDGDGYKDWTQRQEDELGRAARRVELAKKSPPKGSWLVVLALAAAAIATVVIVHTIAWKTGDTIAGPVLAVAFLALFVPFFLRRWRLTPEGAAAVRSWRREGHGESGGAMRGLGTDSGRTVWALDGPGGAPLPRGHAWSSLGGQWHTVRLGQELTRPSWSTLGGLASVIGLAALGSFFSLMLGGVAFGFGPKGELIAIVPATLAVIVIAAFWAPAFSSRMRLPDDVAFTGEVVRLEYVKGDDESPDEHLVWIDDASPTSMKFDVAPGMYQRLSVGNQVLVNWSPRRRCLNDITHAG